MSLERGEHLGQFEFPERLYGPIGYDTPRRNLVAEFEGSGLTHDGVFDYVGYWLKHDIRTLSPATLGRMPTAPEEGRLTILRRTLLDVGEGIPGRFGALYLDRHRVDLEALTLAHTRITNAPHRDGKISRESEVEIQRYFDRFDYTARELAAVHQAQDLYFPLIQQ